MFWNELIWQDVNVFFLLLKENAFLYKKNLAERKNKFTKNFQSLPLRNVQLHQKIFLLSHLIFLNRAV